MSVLHEVLVLYFLMVVMFHRDRLLIAIFFFTYFVSNANLLQILVISVVLEIVYMKLKMVTV